ncbi:MAG TPA: hypothetical protein VN722_06900 [Hanamia sp.]|nr:hypothetical protein [Hanamia sp.]
MKNLLLLFFFALSYNSYAQVNSVMPAEATSFYNSAMQKIKPELKATIEKNANKLKGRIVNIDSLSAELRKDSFLKNSNQDDLHAIVILIMVQISRNADADLKNLVIHMHKKNDQAPKTNSTVNESSGNMVESILANKRLIAENVSSVMEKLPATPETLIDQLK